METPINMLKLNIILDYYNRIRVHTSLNNVNNFLLR